MATNVYYVVHPAPDPVVALVITACTVASELVKLASITPNASLGTHVVSLVHVEISIHVPLVSAPDCAGHAGPRLLEGEHTLDIVAVDLFTGHRVDDGGLNAEEGQRRGPRLCWSNTTQRCDDMRASLGLPICLLPLVRVHLSRIGAFSHVYNMCLLLSDDLEIPLPHLGGDGLSDGSQHT